MIWYRVVVSKMVTDEYVIKAADEDEAKEKAEWLRGVVAVKQVIPVHDMKEVDAYEEE